MDPGTLLMTGPLGAFRDRKITKQDICLVSIGYATMNDRQYQNKDDEWGRHNGCVYLWGLSRGESHGEEGHPERS